MLCYKVNYADPSKLKIYCQDIVCYNVCCNLLHGFVIFYQQAFHLTLQFKLQIIVAYE